MMSLNFLCFTAAVATSLSPQIEAFVPVAHTIHSRQHYRPLRLSSRTSDDLLTSDASIASSANGVPVDRAVTHIFDPVSTSSNPTDMAATHIFESASETSSTYQFSPLQMTMRGLPFLTAGFYAVNPEPLDAAVATVWDFIYNCDIAQNPLFEAEVASFGFLLWIASFSVLHLLLGEKKTKESRFDGDMPHDPLEWARFENWHLWFNPLASYLVSIWLWLQIHDKPPMPELAPTFGVLTVEVVFGVWLYDLCFFPVHYLMHRVELGSMRKIHGYHHRTGMTTMNALETVQHSYIDGFLQVLVNVVVQHISPFGGPKHVLSRLLHNLTVTYLLSEAHSGYDLPWMSHNVFPEIFGGSRRHEKHHAYGKVYYQQYFKYIDDCLGFTEEKQELPPPRHKRKESKVIHAMDHVSSAISVPTEIKA